MKKRLFTYVSPFVFFFFVYFAFFNHVEPNTVGIARNHITGQTWVEHAGWHWSAPWVWVANIETNPIRVGIPTAGRGFNAKLVRFIPKHADAFLKQEGWRYYWWDNRLSFNFGNPDEYRGNRNLFLGYAYTQETPIFLEVLKEYGQ